MATRHFDFTRPNLQEVRQIVIQRLREDGSWMQIDPTGEGFLPYVEMQGLDVGRFASFANDVCWQFLTTGVLAPGSNYDLRLPFFHLTPFGSAFIRIGEWPVYDPSEYLVRLAQQTPNPDPTVLSYLTESLRSFQRGSFVAASVMLGIAAERAFLLLCAATLDALSDSGQKEAFGRLMDRYQIKPKLDWLHAKFGELQKKGPPGFPDNACLTVTGIYDLLRSQRNDLGHPRENPPSPEPDGVLSSLQIFPQFFKASEAIRAVLLKSKI